MPGPYRAGPTSLATHDLRSTVLAVLRELEPMAALRLVQVEVAMPESLIADVSTPVLQDAIRTVLAGAIGRAAGGAVLVTGQRLGGVLELMVLDDGAPRTPEELRSVLRPVAEQLGAEGCALAVPEGSASPVLAPNAGAITASAGSTVVLHVPAGGQAAPPAWQRPRGGEIRLPRVATPG